MATCPNCLARSREDPEAMQIGVVHDVEPLLKDEHLFGDSLMFSVREQLELRCNRCGWHVRGYIDNDSFVADPSTQDIGP